MPILFAHRGYSPYLEFSLRQAQAASPDSEIVLLGTPDNDGFPWVRHVDVTAPPYTAAVEPFGEVYEHMSTNRASFERICFDRWSQINAFFQESGTAEALVLDTDVMLYDTEAAIRSHWIGESQGLAVVQPSEQPGYRWAASPGVSWWSAEKLEAFCAFLIESYSVSTKRASLRAKWDHHRANGIGGGVCDMTLLHLFVESLDPAAWVNFARVHDGVAQDLNVASAENYWPGEYRMSKGIKAATWDGDGRPWCENVKENRPVRFQTLHFVGGSKSDLAEAYRGPRFPGQQSLRWKMRSRYAARRATSAALKPLRQLRARLAG